MARATTERAGKRWVGRTWVAPERKEGREAGRLPKSGRIHDGSRGRPRAWADEGEGGPKVGRAVTVGSEGAGASRGGRRYSQRVQAHEGEGTWGESRRVTIGREGDDG